MITLYDFSNYSTKNIKVVYNEKSIIYEIFYILFFHIFTWNIKCLVNYVFYKSALIHLGFEEWDDSINITKM